MGRKLSENELLLMDWLAGHKAIEKEGREWVLCGNTYGIRSKGGIMDAWAWRFYLKLPTPSVLSIGRKMEKKGLCKIQKNENPDRKTQYILAAKLTKKGWLLYAEMRELPIYRCEEISYDLGVLNHSCIRKELWAKMGDDRCYKGLVDYRTPEQLKEYAWWSERD
jgi:hypothetical protein